MFFHGDITPRACNFDIFRCPGRAGGRIRRPSTHGPCPSAGEGAAASVPLAPPPLPPNPPHASHVSPHHAGQLRLFLLQAAQHLALDAEHAALAAP